MCTIFLFACHLFNTASIYFGTDTATISDCEIRTTARNVLMLVSRACLGNETSLKKFHFFLVFQYCYEKNVFGNQFKG